MNGIGDQEVFRRFHHEDWATSLFWPDEVSGTPPFLAYSKSRGHAAISGGRPLLAL